MSDISGRHHSGSRPNDPSEAYRRWRKPSMAAKGGLPCSPVNSCWSSPHEGATRAGKESSVSEPKQQDDRGVIRHFVEDCFEVWLHFTWNKQSNFSMLGACPEDACGMLQAPHEQRYDNSARTQYPSVSWVAALTDLTWCARFAIDFSLHQNWCFMTHCVN